MVLFVLSVGDKVFIHHASRLLGFPFANQLHWGGEGRGERVLEGERGGGRRGRDRRGWRVRERRNTEGRGEGR